VDGTTVDERAFTRLCGVPRTTRQDWARAGALGQQASPYVLKELHRVVILHKLRRRLRRDAFTVWRELEPLAHDMARRRPCEALVDLDQLWAEWLKRDAQIVAMARTGHRLLLVSFDNELDAAGQAFARCARG
jgi:hypothetical protein